MKRLTVALIASSIALTACPRTEKPRSAPTSLPSPSPSVSASPTPAAPSPEWFIFQNTTRSAEGKRISTIYRSDPLSLQRHRLAFPPVLGTLLASPDGHRLARLSGRTLWTAPSDHPTRLRRIATARGPGEAMMAQVVWDRKSSMLVYRTWRATGPDDMPHSSFVNEIYIARFDGTRKRLIKRFDTPTFAVLKAFDAAQHRLFWFETGDGGYESNLTEVDTDTGKVVRIHRELPNALYNSFAMSSDLSKARYATTDVIAEYSLKTRKTRTLYRTGASKDAHGNQSTILHSVMRPAPAEVIFTVHHESSDKDITYRLSFATGRRATVFGKPGFYNLAVLDVSPSGRYLWLQTFCLGCGEDHGYDNRGKYYVLDTMTRRVVVAAEDAAPNETSVQFLCWLRV